MKFFVNFLSAFRIAAAFAIIPTLMFQWYWLSFILFVLGAVSDWFDGFLARKYNVCSKIGGVMDHIGDKLLVVNTLIMLTVMMPTWFIVVPVIIMIARELYISGLRDFWAPRKLKCQCQRHAFPWARLKPHCNDNDCGVPGSVCNDNNCIAGRHYTQRSYHDEHYFPDWYIWIVAVTAGICLERHPVHIHICAKIKKIK